MSFQILTSDKQGININALDAEACAFWNKPVQPKSYCTPREGTAEHHYMDSGVNWFDSIGWNIHSNNSINHKRYDGTITWQMVKESMCLIQIDVLKLLNESDELILRKIKFNKEYLKPYFDLIDHWEAKGYIPVQIKE